MVKTYGRINWFRTVPIYCQPYNKKVWITASYAHHYTKYIKNYNCIVQWNPYCIIWNSFKHKLIVATQINNNIYFISANGQQFAIAKTGVSCLGYDSEGLFEKVRGHWYSHEEGGPVPAGCLTLDRHLRDWHAPAATAWAKFHFLVFLSKDMIIVIVLQAHNRNTEKALALFHPSCSLWPNCPLFYTISVSVCPKPHIFSIFKS